MEITAAPSPVKKRNGFKKFLIVTLFIVVAGLAAYYFIAGMAYSEGTRSGILTKVTKKGYVLKTYEGEMMIGGINQGEGTILPNTVFKFSVPEKKVYEQLEQLQGHKVVVRYKQVIKNFFWQGDSDYFIIDVKPVS